MKNLITLIAIYIVFISSVFAQNTLNENRASSENNGQGSLWKKETNTGTIYNNPLNSNVAIGKNTAQVPLDVKGQIRADSIEVDSIHARSIRVGNNSLWLGGIGPNQPNGSSSINLN